YDENEFPQAAHRIAFVEMEKQTEPFFGILRAHGRRKLIDDKFKKCFFVEIAFQLISYVYVSYSFWSAGKNKIAGIQREITRYIGNDRIGTENHIFRIAVLFFHTIYQQFKMKRLLFLFLSYVYKIPHSSGVVKSFGYFPG